MIQSTLVTAAPRLRLAAFTPSAGPVLLRPCTGTPSAAAATARRLLSFTRPAAVTNTTANDPHLIPLYAKPADLTLVRGQGALLFDANNRRFIDFTAGIAVCSLGHADPHIAEILYDQAKTLVHVSNLYRHPWAEQLATQLVASTRRHDSPSSSSNDDGLSHVFFCNSGTEANEAALKFARAFNPDPTKFKILTFHNAFHGRSMGALSATPNRKYQAPFEPLVPGFTSVPFNNLGAARDALAQGGYCGILVEPVQGEGGIYPAEEAFLVGLRALANEHNCLLMLDEIQCGLSRTGRPWAHHWYPAHAAAPDVVTCAKPLGNGVPIGAVLTTARISAALHPGAHGTTFGGNPLACRVASHILDRLMDPTLLAHVASMGQVVQERLKGIQDKAGQAVVTGVRGQGLIAGLELASGDHAKKVVEVCRERGLLICTAGKAGNVMRIVPPLVIEREVLEEGLDVLEGAVGQLAK